MPGIITHNKVFIESLNFLKKNKQRNIYSRSIEVLFKSESFLKAGLFGSIGPNIFDYLPFLRSNFISGSAISYELHSEKSENLLRSMVSSLMSHQDRNTEWISTQRAYLYGLISHLVADSVFHPFIYYWSGFSYSGSRKELFYFREQHLLFENNIDMFFRQTANEYPYDNMFNFVLNDMLPVENTGIRRITERAISELLISALEETCPDTLIKIPGNFGDGRKRYLLSLIINKLPFFIKLAYKIKKSRNPQISNLINFIKKKNLFYSEYLINYPGRINTHILNLHKERWFHPSGVSGLHYESVKDLLSLSCEKTVRIWEKAEEIFNGNKKKLSDFEKELRINSITGIFGKDYKSMQIQNPLHIRV